MPAWVVILIALGAALIAAAIAMAAHVTKLKKSKRYERGLKMVPLLIHLPPSTDDIETGSRDQRDVTLEAISKAGVMYSILASTTAKGFKTKIYGERHFSFEIIAEGGFVKYYAIVPAVLTETVRQAIQSAYPTARIEEKQEPNIFAKDANLSTVAGAELTLDKDYYLPIATYEDTKRDAELALLNAMSSVKSGEGATVQILFRPAQKT